MSRTGLIKSASIISLIGNIALAVLKLFVGVRENSLAVIGDGIDTATDIVIAAIALAVSSIIARPSDAGHPWGHGRAETTATLALSFILLFAGIQLAFQATVSALRITGVLAAAESAHSVNTLLLAVTAVSIAGKLALSASQFVIGKKAASPMILANAKNMRNDVLTSVSVFAGLFLSRIFSLPILDPITALIVSVFIVKNAFSIFTEANTELMDGSTGKEIYQTLFDVVKSVRGVFNPHRARIRKIGSMLAIDLDVEVDAQTTVADAHTITDELENMIHAAIPDIYDIMIHVEPAGIDDTFRSGTESFGLTEDDVK